MTASVYTQDTDSKAEEMWPNLTESERAGIHFGLFPHDKMTAAAKEGFDCYQLSLSLMRVARKKKNGLRA